MTHLILKRIRLLVFDSLDEPFYNILQMSSSVKQVVSDSLHIYLRTHLSRPTIFAAIALVKRSLLQGHSK